MVQHYVHCMYYLVHTSSLVKLSNMLTCVDDQDMDVIVIQKNSSSGSQRTPYFCSMMRTGLVGNFVRGLIRNISCLLVVAHSYHSCSCVCVAARQSIAKRHIFDVRGVGRQETQQTA